MIDSHCHLDHEPLLSNLNEVIKRSKDVNKIVVNNINVSKLFKNKRNNQKR